MEGDGTEKLLRAAEDEIEEQNFKRRIWVENKKMWVVAGPAMFTRFSTFGINVISQAFIGHIGSTELAAYALVLTLLTRFANGLLLGLANGLETLCGQAYGAKQYHMLGIYLQRSWIVLTVCTTLLLPVYIFAAPILKALGQDEDIAEMAGTIALWFIPVIYSYILSFSCQMYLQAQSKNMIITYLAVFSLSIHIFLSWLLTVKYSFGLAGAMISTILAYWIPNIGQLIFVLSGGCRETWKGFTTLAFKDLWLVVKLSLSSGAMLCLELWYNAILIILTGNMKNAEVEVSALSICLNISGWEMMISLGFMAAASVRVANELGKGDSKAAKFSILNVVLISFASGFILFVFFLFFRERLAYIFTKEHGVAEEVGHLSPLLALTILLNSIQPILSGVAVGAGWQSVVVYVNLGSYYLIGIPIGVLLGYVIKLQVEGVWIGMLIGTLIQTIILLVITQRTDWDKQVAIARKRVNRWCVAVEPDVLGQLIFVISGGCRETWRDFTTLAFKDLWLVVKLSLSSGAMLCLELWYNAILILLTGNLKNAEVELDALSICLNINGWEMMISLGFLAAASANILFHWILAVRTFLFLRERLAYIFTKDHNVAAEVAHLSPLLAFSILLNSIQPVLSGVAIGAGWQSVVVYVNLGSYYLIGILVGVLLGYVIKLQVEVSIARTRVNRWFVEAEPTDNSGAA
ncbi:UNVERIFIED_CONTAM: protein DETOXIFICATION 21 [Sesamum radiatum]|uniref:Protein DETOXIFICATION n=1 Tax=Sesamum radiatum TaxID=300843 RepID=A0AAW2N7Y6_SESRA